METNENESGLLDLLVVVAENIKLLILGPLAVGLLALGLAFVMPQSYVSRAILVLPSSSQGQMLAQTQALERAAAMMVSPLVLDQVIDSLKLSVGLSAEAARQQVGAQIKASAGKDGLLRLDVTAGSPAEAQNLASAVIDGWLKTTIPNEMERADLMRRFGYAKDSLDSVHRVLSRLSDEGSASLNKSLTRNDGAMAAQLELKKRYMDEILEITNLLNGLSRDVVKQPPTLPVDPVAPRKGLIAALSVLATGMLLLLWIFMRQAWLDAEQDPLRAPKIARLRMALSLK